MPEIKYEVDELDYEWIRAAIARAQAFYRVGGELIIADGEGSLGGRILGVICRAWIDAYGGGCEGGPTGEPRR